MERIEFRAQREIFSGRIEINVLRVGLPGGCKELARPLTFEAYPEDTYIADRTMRIEPDEAQRLMDELWACGIRPAAGAGTAGAMAATEKHLEDMRNIAFDLLERSASK
jgi:hypothetical protein